LAEEMTMDWLIGTVPIALLVLMCPLMMIFMMRGMHGGHGRPTGHQDASSDDRIAELEQQVRELREERDGKRKTAA
jgi:hypothetical protein